MFQSLRFKTLLGFTYIANYQYLIETIASSDKYVHLGVQILTIPEIALAILKDYTLRKTFWNSFKELSTIGKGSPDYMRKGFFYMFSDFKYMLKEDSLKYLLANGIIEDFISHLSSL